VLGGNDTRKNRISRTSPISDDGGQKGPQRNVLPKATYAINTTQFAIITDERVYGHALSPRSRFVLDGMMLDLTDRGVCPVVLAANQDLVGVVTCMTARRSAGEIIARRSHRSAPA